MDEILIEDKKYVSSKKAAKITGYAKDYIGQLCREGRVPARLIGRGWYVLESAIQDHRFGAEDEKQKSQSKEEKKEEVFISATWETPIYTPVQEEILPSVNKLRENEKKTDEIKEQGTIEDSWNSWFERFGQDSEDLPAEAEKQEAQGEEKEELFRGAEEAVDIPIRTIYGVPEDLLPRRAHRGPLNDEKVTKEEEPKDSRKPVRSTRAIGLFARTIVIAGALLALGTFTLAVFGSGLADSYLISDNRVHVFAGIILYNK